MFNVNRPHAIVILYRLQGYTAWWFMIIYEKQTQPCFFTFSFFKPHVHPVPWKPCKPKSTTRRIIVTNALHCIVWLPVGVGITNFVCVFLWFIHSSSLALGCINPRYLGSILECCLYTVLLVLIIYLQTVPLQSIGHCLEWYN